MAPKPLSVLLVDDDPTYAKVVQMYLQRFPAREFRVTWKESVLAALAEIDQNREYDVIITDYTFPTSNGLDFCLQLSRLESKIPIIFLTAVRDFKLAVEAMKLGVEDFIVKDELTETHLAKTVVNVYERAQTRKGLQSVSRSRKLAESRSEAVKELVVTVCHEFNNPLAAIKISTDLLSRMFSGPRERALLEEFETAFTSVEREIIRLRDMNFEKVDFHGRVGSIAKDSR